MAQAKTNDDDLSSLQMKQILPLNSEVNKFYIQGFGDKDSDKYIAACQLPFLGPKEYKPEEFFQAIEKAEISGVFVPIVLKDKPREAAFLAKYDLHGNMESFVITPTNAQHMVNLLYYVKDNQHLFEHYQIGSYIYDMSTGANFLRLDPKKANEERLYLALEFSKIKGSYFGEPLNEVVLLPKIIEERIERQAIRKPLSFTHK